MVGNRRRNDPRDRDVARRVLRRNAERGAPRPVLAQGPSRTLTPHPERRSRSPPQDNPLVTSGSDERVNRSGPTTGRFTRRRFKSAISSWRASMRGTDVLVASVFAALSLGLGAYLF